MDQQFLLTLESPIIIIDIMRNLQEFEVTNGQTIFNEATKLPSFFDSNLVEPTRVVKLFENDVQANIRVFYYQYLKLCFEVNECDYEQYIRKIEEIINDPNFSFVFDEAEDPSVFNDLQFKQLIMEFFGLLGNGNMNIEACLNSYPIMDTVFIYFFRSILILTNATEGLNSYIDKMTLFNILINHFNVEINVHENCIRFPQTDIFVYEEQPEEVFMAYIEGEPENELPVSREYVSYETSEETIAAPPQNKSPEAKPQQAPAPQKLIAPKSQESNANREGVTIIKDSYVEDDFLDYTSNGPALHTLVKPNKLKQSGTLDHQEVLKATNVHQKSQFKPKGVKIEQPKYTPPVKIQEPPKIVQLPQYKVAKSDYQSDYSSKSQYNQMMNATDNILNNILGKSQKSFETSSNKNINQFSNPNFAPANEFESFYKPKTVDNQYNVTSAYGSMSYQPNNFLAQSQKSIQANNFSQSNNYLQTFTSSNVTNNFSIPFNNNKPVIGNQPKFDMYNKVQTKKPTSYNPLAPTSFQVKKPSSFDPLNPSSKLISPPSKNPCGLDVSDEFTNSFTMKIMNQPHRSSVSGIRQRARNFRNSLKNFIK